MMKPCDNCVCPRDSSVVPCEAVDCSFSFLLSVPSVYIPEFTHSSGDGRTIELFLLGTVTNNAAPRIFASAVGLTCVRYL